MSIWWSSYGDARIHNRDGRSSANAGDEDHPVVEASRSGAGDDCRLGLAAQLLRA